MFIDSVGVAARAPSAGRRLWSAAPFSSPPLRSPLAVMVTQGVHRSMPPGCARISPPLPRPRPTHPRTPLAFCVCISVCAAGGRNGSLTSRLRVLGVALFGLIQIATGRDYLSVAVLGRAHDEDAEAFAFALPPTRFTYRWACFFHTRAVQKARDPAAPRRVPLAKLYRGARGLASAVRARLMGCGGVETGRRG